MGTSTFATEYAALQRITGDSSATSLVAFKQALNDANKIVNEVFDWPWLRVRSAVNLIAAYSTGTITVTAAATTLTSSGATWSSTWSPVRIRTAAGHEYEATESGGTWTLSSAAVATETAVTYTLYKDTYALLARLRSLTIGWGTTQTAYPLELVDQNEMQVLRTTFTTSTPVEKCALVEPDSTNLVSQLMVWPVPSAVQVVHYRGIRETADLSADGDVFQFPGHVLPVYRRLARALTWEYRGALQRGAQERRLYEIDMARLVAAADDTAHAQDSVRLDEHHFRPQTQTEDGIGYSDCY